MMLHCAEIIVAWLIKHKTIRYYDKELYEYAVYSILLSVMPLIIIMIIGNLMGKTKESIFVILPFMIVRKYSGGFHTKYSWTCFLGSCGLLFLCIYMATHIQYSIELSIVTLIAVLSLCIFSPIDSENRRLTFEEKKRYKRITCVIAIVFLDLFAILRVLGADDYAVCIAIGLILSSLLQMPCVFTNICRQLIIFKKQ